MTTMKIEERLDTLDNEFEEVKRLMLAVDENKKRAEILLETIGRQLQHHERTINNGELLSTYGIMSQPKQVATSYELKGSQIENGDEIISTFETKTEDHERSFTKV